MLRRIFSDNPGFYRIYYHLIRKNRGIRPSFFTSETNIYYDGYPRSGNTFLNQLIIHVFPDLNAVHHLHKVAPIKIALNKDIPAFILIRNPDDAISSNYLKHYAQGGVLPEDLNVDLLDKMVDDYYYYYKFVHNNRRLIHVIEFKELIGNPLKIITMIADQMNIDGGDESLINEKVRQATSTYSGAKTKYGSSKPNIHKEQEKDKIKKKLPLITNYQEVREIYNEVIG